MTLRYTLRLPGTLPTPVGAAAGNDGQPIDATVDEFPWRGKPDVRRGIAKAQAHDHANLQVLAAWRKLNA